MSDRIVVTGLAADAVIGVYDWERRVRQRLRLDLELRCDLRSAGATDRLSDTLDYKTLAGRVISRVAASRYQLVESLAADVVETCLEDPRVLAATVTVHKPDALREASDVAVTVERARGDPTGRAPHRAFVGIGSNVDPVLHVRRALQRLHDRFGAIRVSPAYRTTPIGIESDVDGDNDGADAPVADFLNLAVELRTDLTPADLVTWLRAVEADAGRVRRGPPPGPRTLDLDLLLYDDLVAAGPPALPHRLLAEAPFVLVPMADLAPELPHPTAGAALGELRARLPVAVPGVALYTDEVLY